MLRPSLLTLGLALPVLALAGPDVLAQHGVDRARVVALVPDVLKSGLDAAPTSAGGLFTSAPAALSPAVRVSLVKGTLEAVKAAVATPAVQDALLALSGERPPEDPRVNFAEQEREGREQLKAFVETDTSKLPAKDRAEFEKLKRTTKENFDTMLARQREQLPAAVKQYEADLAEWRKAQRPAAEVTREATRKLLTDFLDGTKAMPWTAALKSAQGRKVFADAALEAKPNWWKACFRAGKEPVEAARAFAQAWLAELK